MYWDKAGERLTFGTHHSVVALLGATGSGKSSIANAIVGTDIATTGVRRPTTSSTLACTWGDTDSTPLLDWLEVKNRHTVPATNEVSTVWSSSTYPTTTRYKVQHRLEMERIAEHADLLLFVTDPEKYADAALHRYLSLAPPARSGHRRRAQQGRHPHQRRPHTCAGPISPSCCWPME